MWLLVVFITINGNVIETHHPYVFKADCQQQVVLINNSGSKDLISGCIEQK